MFPDRQDLLDRGVVMREWEESVEGVNPADLSWESLLRNWHLIETDFQNFYHLDLSDPVVGNRSMRWFTVRVVRLLREDTALGREVRRKGE